METTFYTRHALLLIPLSLLLAHPPRCGAADPAPVVRETLTTRAFAQDTGEPHGTSRADLSYEPGRTRLVEFRTSPKGKTENLDVTFDPETLAPLSWTRLVGDGTTTVRTELSISNGTMTAQTFEGDRLVRATTKSVPGEPWCVAPLVRFKASRFAASSASVAMVHAVGIDEDGSFKVTEVKFSNLGPATVEVPAGTFACRHLRLAPQVKFISSLVPAGDLFVGDDGTRPLVKSVMPPNLRGATIVTELSAYTIATNAPVASIPPP